MKYKKAEAGIGTLILFIAMILVAAVAAGVLIQTASSLQSKALDTGSKTKTQVSTSLVPVQMFIEDTSNLSEPSTRTYNHSFLKVRLSAGSDSIRINDALLQVDTFSARSSLRYNATVDCTNYTTMASLGDIYGSNFIKGGTDPNYLEQGDVVELCFLLPDNIAEAAPLRVSFIPKVGQTTTLNVLTPQVMVNAREIVYP